MLQRNSRTFGFLLLACLLLVVVDGKIRGEQGQTEDERDLGILGKTLPPGGILAKFKKPKPVPPAPKAPVKAPKSKGPTKAKAPKDKRVLEEDEGKILGEQGPTEDERDLGILGKTLPPGGILAKFKKPKPVPPVPKAPVKAPKSKGPAKAKAPTVKRALEEDEVDERNLQKLPPPPTAPKAPAPKAPKAPVTPLGQKIAPVIKGILKPKPTAPKAP